MNKRNANPPLALFLPIFILVIAAFAAYSNSFSASFLFDDRYYITQNPFIQHLWPWPAVFKGAERPVVLLSFAFNYALHDFQVWGYHLFNLLIHLFAGLILMEIIRKSLLLPKFKGRYQDSAHSIAFASAILWLLHPLQTQSVTYLVQRSESLMGLFYLLTLYAVIRSHAPHPNPLPASGARGNSLFSLYPLGKGQGEGWCVASIIFCALGMATKAEMVTAPILILIYDRFFLANSWEQLWEKRKQLYFGLFSTWLLLVLLLIPLRHASDLSAGFAIKNRQPWQYWLTQPAVVLHYLRLALWPHPLVFDYDWPLASGIQQSLPSVLMIGLLIVFALGACFKFPSAAFLGISFFILLAPTSLVPLTDGAEEYRMYLALAPLLTGIVLIVHRLRLQRIAVGFFLFVSLTYGILTFQRNRDYQNDFTIWSDTLKKRPENARAHNNFGEALARLGRVHEAEEHYEKALSLKPNYMEAHNNLGNTLIKLGKYTESIPHFEAAVALEPEFSPVYNNWGVALASLGRYEEALEEFQKALHLHFESPDIHNNMGLIYLNQKRPELAQEQFLQALKLDPKNAYALENRKIAEDEIRKGKLSAGLSAPRSPAG